MNITNYSVYAQKPCFLLQSPNARILLDTPIDFSPYFSFLPHVYQSPRLKNARSAIKFKIPYLKEIGNRIFVDSPPEIFHVSPNMLKMDEVDAILVSNYESFMGLPFYTENHGFKGKIYVTEMAYQYGKLLMQEMLEFMARIESAPDDKEWKKEEICGKFPNPPFQNPVEWRPFYTRDEMHSCLTRVITLSFNQTIDLFHIKVTPVVSGHTYGSAYWTMETENESLAYLTAANARSTDVKQFDILPLKSCDYILATSLSRLIDANAATMGQSLMQNIKETLKGRGSVLLPISPVGPIFEIIEAVNDVIQSTPGISMETPMYLISPVAKSSVAMASISAEWMTGSRHEALFRPEEPFCHHDLIRNKRLKIYDSLYGAFSKEYKTPCVIFASHPSMRIGDAAHMVEVLGNDQRNAVILTDPDLSCEEVREPFRSLPIRFVNVPMDFRLDFGQLHQLLAEVKPKYVLCSSAYIQPMGRRPDLRINYEKLWPIEYDEAVQLSKLSRNKRKLVTVEVHPDVVKSMQFKQHPTKKLAIATVACHLNAYNDEFKLVATKDKVAKRAFGRVTVEKLLKALRAAGLKVEEEADPDEDNDDLEDGQVVEVKDDVVLFLDELEAKITVRKDGTKTKVTAQSSENREKILAVVKTLLVEDDGIVGRKN